MNTATEQPPPPAPDHVRRGAIAKTHTTKGTDMTATIERLTDRALAPPAITVTQYSLKAIVGIWAAAALPMGALAWIVAPAIANGSDIDSLVRPLIACLTVGLMWQFVLAVSLVAYEQRSLRWSRIKQAMWLRSPRSPKTGRRGGRTWFIAIPIVLGLGLEEMLSISAPLNRNFGEFLSSDAGKVFFDGAWGLFALFMVMSVFNTVLGEELLFRGVLLPRMHGAFGDKDWLANGVLFGAYHLHMPWVIPISVLMDPFLYAYPAKRYGSALLGIVVHSGQTVVIGLLVLSVVA